MTSALAVLAAVAPGDGAKSPHSQRLAPRALWSLTLMLRDDPTIFELFCSSYAQSFPFAIQELPRTSSLYHFTALTSVVSAF
jgi:hypothetical protein